MSDTVFEAVGLLIFGGWVVCVIKALVVSHALFRYLQDNYYGRWSYLTTWGPWGPGMLNSLRSVPYVFNDQDCDDPEIAKLKRKNRSAIFLVIGYWLSMLLLLITVAIIAAATGHLSR